MTTDFICTWDVPRVFPFLKLGDIHVWCAHLDQDVNTLPNFSELLSASEQARAQRFLFEKDRYRFTVARGILRLLLGQYFRQDPKTLDFEYNIHDKPFIAQPSGLQLQFNISHSEHVALFAFGLQHELGIDIESINRECEMDAIAQRFFTINETHYIQSLVGTAKTQAFFNAWVRKEAFLKALGAGLSYPLNQLEVSLVPDEPAKILALQDPQLNITDWSIYSLNPLANFTAALVVKAATQRILTWQWPNK